jgi:hypothetical protein
MSMLRFCEAGGPNFGRTSISCCSPHAEQVKLHADVTLPDKTSGDGVGLENDLRSGCRAPESEGLGVATAHDLGLLSTLVPVSHRWSVSQPGGRLLLRLLAR